MGGGASGGGLGEAIDAVKTFVNRQIKNAEDIGGKADSAARDAEKKSGVNINGGASGSTKFGEGESGKSGDTSFGGNVGGVPYGQQPDYVVLPDNPSDANRAKIETPGYGDAAKTRPALPDHLNPGGLPFLPTNSQTPTNPSIVPASAGVGDPIELRAQKRRLQYRKYVKERGL